MRVLVDYLAPGGVRCEYATTLGAGGLFIESEAPLPVGTALTVRFRLPTGRRLHEIEGRVAWTHAPEARAGDARAPGMGIAFTRATATTQLAHELETLAGT